MDDQEGESRKRRRVPRSQRVEKQHSQPHVNTRLTVVNSHRTCLYTNIDSMLNKRSEINALVQLHTPSFIALVEVKPKNCRYEINEYELELQNYEAYHNLNDDGRGVCFYVHKTIKSTRCETVNSKGANEVLFVECGTGEDRLLVGVIYRSPNSPPDNNANLSSLIRGLDDIRKSHSRILQVSDFNYPEIDWNRGTCGKAITHPARDFLSATQDAFLSQLQLEPTRIRDGQTRNCLDLVLTSTDNIVSEINILPGVGRSDHVTLLLKLLISNTNTPTPPARFKYEKGDCC